MFYFKPLNLNNYKHCMNTVNCQCLMFKWIIYVCKIFFQSTVINMDAPRQLIGSTDDGQLIVDKDTADLLSRQNGTVSVVSIVGKCRILLVFCFLLYFIIITFISKQN